MTIRKVVFGAGLVVSVAGVAFAGERSRGTSGDAVGGGPTDMAAPVAQGIAPGVAKLSVGGIEMTARADGSVRLNDVIAEHGSLDRYLFNSQVINTPMLRAGDGSTVFGNGAVGFFADLLGPNAPVAPVITTAEDYKAVAAWTEMVVGSSTVTVFANGVTFNDGSLSTEPAWAQHARTHPSVINGNDPIFADGATFSH